MSLSAFFQTTITTGYTPTFYHGIGASIDDRDGLITYSSNNWIQYNGGGDYYNGGCTYLNVNDVGGAFLNSPIKGNGLRWKTGSNSAGRGLVFEIRQHTPNGTANWFTLGTVSGTSYAAGDLTLPNNYTYYDVRFKQPGNGLYTVIDVLEVI